MANVFFRHSFIMVHFSFPVDDISLLTQKVEQEAADFAAPPPPKRLKTDEPLPNSSVISLSRFLSTPHKKDLLIKVYIFFCLLKIKFTITNSKMVVCGTYLPKYNMEGVGYMKIIVGDVK